MQGWIFGEGDGGFTGDERCFWGGDRDIYGNAESEWEEWEEWGNGGNGRCVGEEAAGESVDWVGSGGDLSDCGGFYDCSAVAEGASPDTGGV